MLFKRVVLENFANFAKQKKGKHVLETFFFKKESNTDVFMGNLRSF